MKTFYLILSFCMGLFLGYVLFNNENENLNPPSSSIPVTVLEKVKSIDSAKANADLSLKRQNDFLRSQLAVADHQVKVNRLRLETERSKVSRLQAKLASDSSYNENSAADSLNLTIGAVNAVTDSLIVDYEHRIQLSDSIVAVKDSLIVVCDLAYNQIKDIAKEQALREQQLTESLNASLKQERKKRMQNRLLAGGMVFLTGVATSLIIHRK